MEGDDAAGRPARALSEAQRRTLAGWIAGLEKTAAPTVIGINGAQGSGKSTLACWLREALGRVGRNAVVLSIDDFYLTRAEREALARQVHPLLRTRGVPGTHDAALALDVLEALPRATKDRPVRLPRFIKAIDDRAPEAQWTAIEQPPELVLFEGWCVNLPPQQPQELEAPVNALESAEDADGVWRHYVNAQLQRYQTLFGRIGRTIFLQAPDFAAIHRWRLQQEQGNASELDATGNSRLMGPQELERFIQHYERLTRHALRLMPQRADAVVRLGAEHEWTELSFK